MMDIREDLERELGKAYTIERELGGGGMSRVFVATETALDRRVVVKVLPRELLAGISIERFNREILLAARLQHAHIVPVHTAGSMDGIPYYTMPLVEGESLRERLNRDGALPVAESVSILRDVARALGYAHAHGVIHRDIKPDNILLSSGSAVVTDFGIAKALAASRTLAGEAQPSSALTAFGSTLGTPAYMAPEQAAADSTADHRVDVYAFGATAYEMLAGRPPFVSPSLQRLLAMQMSERPTPISEVSPSVPPGLAELIMRCLEKDPADRPESAAAILASLDAVTTGESLGASSLQRVSLGKALAIYAVAFVLVAFAAKGAIAAIGLPDWVFPGAIAVMALGLPMVLFTAYAQRMSRAQRTPTGTVQALAMKAGARASWRRTTLGGVAAVGAFALMIATLMILREFGLGPLKSLLAAGRLNADKPILVADFNVTGADSGLRTVIGEAVRTDLGQSKAVSVLSPSAIAGALGRMKKPLTTRLDAIVAREVALREGATAIVTGDLTPLGQGFVVTIRLVTADSGIELASVHEVAGTPTDLIPVLGKLTHKLRERIGESLKSVRASEPLSNVTTSSLEALQYYAEGARLNDIEGNYAGAIAPLRRAVAVDSEFAMAWRKLGSAIVNTGRRTPESDTAAVRAFRLRERLPEREGHLAAGFYYSNFVRDRAKAIAAYDSASRLGLGHNNLGLLYGGQRDWVRAESAFKAGMISKEPLAQLWVNIMGPLIAQGKFDEALRVSREGRARYPGSTVFDEWEWAILYNQGKIDTALSIVDRVAKSNQPQKDFMMFINSAAAVRAGHLRGAQLRAAAPGSWDATLQQTFPDVWYRQRFDAVAASLEAQLVAKPLSTLPVEQRPFVTIARMFALAGKPARARQILDERARAVPDTAAANASSPLYQLVLAEIAIAENRGRDAAKYFLAADIGTDGAPANSCAECLWVNLARSHDRGGNRDSAIMMFERYLGTPNMAKIRSDAQYLAGVHKRLGELYEEKGDRAKAVEHYQAFVSLWNNADPDLQPFVTEVRKRLDRLGAGSG